MKILLFLIRITKKIESILLKLKYVEFRKKYKIDKNFKFNGKGIIFYGNGEIICGTNSYIGRYSSIQAHIGQKVIIGNNVSISHFVKIYTRNSLADQDFKLKSKECFEYRKGDVIIEDNCWIGAGVFINEGVKIGENSVIGANSVVTKDIPPFAIAAGIPARIIKFKKCKSNYE